MSKYFIPISGLPIIDVHDEFFAILQRHNIPWKYKESYQICLNSIPDHTHDPFFGNGSLTYDWDRSYITESGEVVVPLREEPLKEPDFTELCDIFKGTSFETIYAELKKKYKVGRVRVMSLVPKTCLSWHIDDTNRVHYPIKTYPECFMVINDEVKHLKENEWYETHTTHPHTVFNGSKNVRLHIVAAIL